MTKNKGKISIVNFSNYNSPKIEENSRKNWVEYGEDNNYFQYIIDRNNGSPTNSACNNGIIQMIYGQGIDATNSSKKPEQYAEMRKLLKPECVFNTANDLKLLGMAAVQVVYSTKRQIIEVEHIPVETLRPEIVNEDGDVEAYYYFPDWANIKQTDEPKRIPSFGMSKEAVEILYMKPYKSGFYYFSPVDYQGGLQYAELEEEISNYHLNNILNGLAPSMLINMNNGVPDEETRRKVEADINAKYGGTSNAGKIILGFNKDKESAATIEAIQLSDAHNQYQFLSDESMKKIMVAHRVVSPMLLGIKDNTGLGNNADELRQASILMDNVVIRPFQNILIEGFNKILNYNDIVLNLYFKTLQPLEFIDMGGNAIDEETREEETGVKLSKTLEEFGEDEDLEKWELIDERKVDYDSEEALDSEIEKLNNPKKSMLSKIWDFASTGTARPNAKSSQDGATEDYQYKVRYQYAPLRASDDSRDFCKKMVSAKKIYRKEDIQKMNSTVVNYGWAKKGEQSKGYDIWLYKGGGDCHHYWMRKTYRAKGKPDAKNPNAEVSVNKAKKDGFKPEVNAREVAKRPVDMPNNGFVNKKR